MDASLWSRDAIIIIFIARYSLEHHHAARVLPSSVLSVLFLLKLSF